MLNRITAFILSAAICLIVQESLSLPANPRNESQVPRLTLRIPISSTPLPEFAESSASEEESFRKLCESAEGKATGRPFGFNKVRYRNSDYGIEIFGCITNNSGRTIGSYDDTLRFFETTITSPVVPYADIEGTISPEGIFLSGLLTVGPLIPKGHTKFFRAFYLPSRTNTATTIINQPSPPGQSKTYAPVQRLEITIVR